MWIGRRGEGAVPSSRLENAFGESPDHLSTQVARIEQDEIVDDHPVLDIAETVDQLWRARAPAADDNHLGPHAAQRNIRPCPSPPISSPPCWPSTGAVPRPMSSSSLGQVPCSAAPGSAPATTSWLASKGRCKALTEAYAAVTAAAQRSGAPAPLCPTGVYCLAGIDLPVDEEKLAPAIDALGWTERAILRNDTFAVSRAGTTGHWGIGVVCGTGMNCAAVGPDGRTVRFPALAELSGDFAPGGAWFGPARARPRPAGRRRPGQRHHLARRAPRTARDARRGSRLTGIYSGAIPYARLFELARVLLDAAAEGDAPAREMADILADEITAFVRAAVVRLDLQNEAVEVVLGGGIFDTTDTAFHARVAAGIHAVAPRATLVRLDAPPGPRRRAHRIGGRSAAVPRRPRKPSDSRLDPLSRGPVATRTDCSPRPHLEPPSQLSAATPGSRPRTLRRARGAWRRPPVARRPPAGNGPGP